MHIGYHMLSYVEADGGGSSVICGWATTQCLSSDEVHLRENQGKEKMAR